MIAEKILRECLRTINCHAEPLFSVRNFDTQNRVRGNNSYVVPPELLYGLWENVENEDHL